MYEFKSKNMNYIYYSEYFDDLEPSSTAHQKLELPEIDDRNKKIRSFKYDNSAESLKSVKELKNLPGYTEISATVLYPGLLIGTGMPHDLKGVEGAIYNGFSLDPVSGLPFIPGSSLKGMLRSCFPDKESHVKYSEKREEYIRNIIRKKCYKENVDVNELRQNIFDNNDVFIGAFPVTDKSSKELLDTDFITPHTADWYSKYDPMKRYKNPVPITILKVRGGVEFTFAFILHDMIDESGNLVLGADNKKILFENLLRDFGIGAKTDVGFGKLDITEKSLGVIVTIEKVDNGGYAHFYLGGQDCRITKVEQIAAYHKGYIKNKQLSIGEKVKVKFQENHPSSRGGTYPLYSIEGVIE